jgi:hypothetical protein
MTNPPSIPLGRTSLQYFHFSFVWPIRYEGRSFKEIAAETGVGVNTLLSRKRYAVLHLRARLQRIHDEFIRK